MNYGGLLFIYCLIFGIIVFFNIGKIIDWYRENRYQKTFAGTISRIAEFVFRLLYWPIKILLHALSNITGILFIIGLPIMFIGLFAEAWKERSLAALIFISITALVALYAFASSIYNKFKK